MAGLHANATACFKYCPPSSSNILGGLSPVSEAKTRKQHYLDHAEGVFSCRLCGLSGSFDAIMAVPCPCERQLMAEQAAIRKDCEQEALHNQAVAKELQLAEYLESLEKEEKQLTELLHMQLQQEEETLKLLLAEQAEQASLEISAGEAKAAGIMEDQLPVPMDVDSGSVLLDPMTSRSSRPLNLCVWKLIGWLWRRSLMSQPWYLNLFPTGSSQGSC